MNRRAFLTTAGGAALSPPTSFARRNVPPGCGQPWKWVKDGPVCTPEGAGYNCTPGLCKPMQISELPPKGQQCIDFVPPICSRPVQRPLWSELKLRKNCSQLRKVTSDLTRAYDKLLNLKTAVRRGHRRADQGFR
jgi:hypothetical protein